jgi:hypothetical protein
LAGREEREIETNLEPMEEGSGNRSVGWDFASRLDVIDHGAELGTKIWGA